MSKKARRISEDEIVARKVRLKQGAFHWQNTKDGKHRTLKELAATLHVSPSQLRQWTSSDPQFYPNDDHLKDISIEFGKPLSWFSPESLMNDPSKKYELPSQANELTENTIEPYAEKLGLNDDFLKAVYSLVDFNGLFPAWSPMVQDSSSIYRRMQPFDFKVSAAQSEQGLYQIILSDEAGKNKKVAFLSPADLVFLKAVQDGVKAFIEERFANRRAEMEQEVQAARRAAIEIQSNDGIAITSLTTAEMRLIDNGLNAPTLQQLEEIPVKDEWLDYLDNKELQAFDSGEEFKAAWQRRVTKSKGRSK